jgi:hypothetical protein
MPSLLVGCETVLSMANRLQAYMVFLHGLPPTLTRTNFEAAMTKFYACILQFLAQAIQIYQTPTFTRALKAFWEESDVQDFEQKCHKLGQDLEIEASNCDRTMAAQDRERSQKVKQNLEKALEEIKNIHSVQESLHGLEIKLDLGKVPYARGAMFKSYDQDHTVCHPATRVDLLHQIQDWARQPDSMSIFWLRGKAGTGKSTISWTLAQHLDDEGRLGGSFFFKRGEGDRGNASRFFSTITRGLLIQVKGLDTLIAEVIASDPTIFDKALGEQFDKLIYQPVQKLKLSPHGCPALVVVVDALDECEKEKDIKVILDLWSRLSSISTVPLKLFLTSRPELPVQLGFKRMNADAYRDMILEDAVPRTTIQHDISTFLKAEFSRIREEFNSHQPLGMALGDDWPGDQTLQDLADMAVPFFIAAATVCRFVGDLRLNPCTRLKEILDRRGIGSNSQMEQTYLPGSSR